MKSTPFFFMLFVWIITLKSANIVVKISDSVLKASLVLIDQNEVILLQRKKEENDIKNILFEMPFKSLIDDPFAKSTLYKIYK